MVRKFLYYLDKVLTFFEDWTLLIAVVTALITLFASVATRFGSQWGLTATLTWPEELVREVIIYTTFIGGAASVKKRSLIRIDALPNIFKGLKKPLDYLANTSLIIFGLFFIYYGTKMAAFQAKLNMKTIILQIPQAVLYTILPIMGFIVICRVVHVMYEDYTGIKISDYTSIKIGDIGGKNG
jgi:C4-dicarboxylate transporter DctQ subunit